MVVIGSGAAVHHEEIQADVSIHSRTCKDRSDGTLRKRWIFLETGHSITIDSAFVASPRPMC